MNSSDLESLRGRKDITTREIAELAGCSHSTVSRVFRNIKVKDSDAVERVREILDVTGYEPNPMVRSLMQSRGARRSSKEILTTIGWLNCHRNPKYWTGVYPWCNELYEGTKKRAERLGYGFEQIWAREPGMTGRRLKEIIEARGVRGLVLSNAVTVLDEIDFDHSSFPVVAIGDQLQGQEAWDRVVASERENVELAFRELHQLGYRRIALAVALRLGPSRKGCLAGLNEGKYVRGPIAIMDHYRGQLSGYGYVRQLSEESNQLEPFFYDRNEDDHFREEVAEHIKRLKPDAIICADKAVLDSIEALGLSCPEDIGVAHLGVADDVADWSGIDTNQEELASAAVDILAAKILSNESGVPEHPKCVHLKGVWQSGKTTRKIVS